MIFPIGISTRKSILYVFHEPSYFLVPETCLLYKKKYNLVKETGFGQPKCQPKFTLPVFIILVPKTILQYKTKFSLLYRRQDSGRQNFYQKLTQRVFILILIIFSIEGQTSVPLLPQGSYNRKYHGVHTDHHSVFFKTLILGTR